MVVSLWRNLQHLSAGKKSTSSLMFSLTYLLQRYCKPVVLGTLSMPGYAHHKWYHHLVENFYVYLQAKNQLRPACFYRDIAKIWNLFWVLSACLGTLTHTLTHNDSITLQKTSMFICMQKTNFIIYFFRKILQLRESYKLIGWQHFGP